MLVPSKSFVAQFWFPKLCRLTVSNSELIHALGRDLSGKKECGMCTNGNQQ